MVATCTALSDSTAQRHSDNPKFRSSKVEKLRFKQDDARLCGRQSLIYWVRQVIKASIVEPKASRMILVKLKIRRTLIFEKEQNRI